MQNLENSQLIELLREQTAILRQIKKQNDPLTLADLDPQDRALALDLKIKSTSMTAIVNEYDTNPILQEQVRREERKRESTLRELSKATKATGLF